MQVWKPIKGYEGLYEVSDLGNVKSLKKYHHQRVQILKAKTDKYGYKCVRLSKNAIPKDYTIHRLVAVAFVKNKENKKEVNHIDGNKQNNKVDNLEWCTSSENQIHAYKTGLQKVSGGALMNRKKVRCIDLNITKDSLHDMQLYLYEKGYTKSKRLNRLSQIMNSNKKIYLGMEFEICK